MEKLIAVETDRLLAGTINDEVKSFAESLPDWAKFICEKIFSTGHFHDSDIAISYQYLLEDADLKQRGSRPEIKITSINAASAIYKTDLRLVRLQNVQGVNALAENQTIEFDRNLTIIYGSNGSGKSGYVRLFNNTFVSKGDKTILPDIYTESGHKAPGAELVFKSAGSDYTLKYPEEGANAEFRQFSVFDNKSVPVYLNNRNQFEFRPTGLNFFGVLIDAFKKIEEKLIIAIQLKGTIKEHTSKTFARILNYLSFLKNVGKTLFTLITFS